MSPFQPPARLIFGAAIGLAAVFGVWWLVHRNAQLRLENLDLQQHIETMERMNDAERYLRGLDAGGVSDWLHRRGQ